MTVRLPIVAARRLAEQYGLRQVLILALNAEDDTAHVVTYGTTIEDIAEAGNNLKQHMGWPEELCSAVPARVRRKTSII